MAYGDINSRLDLLEYDTERGYPSSAIKVSDGVIAILNTNTAGKGSLKTYPIAMNGTIGDLIDSWVFEAGTYVGRDNIHKVASGIFLIAYYGPSAYLKVVTIAIDSDGIITEALIDSAANTTAMQDFFGVARKGALNVFVAVMQIGGTDGFVASITCDPDGTNISIIHEWEFEPNRGSQPNIAYVSGDIFVVSYGDATSIGQLATFEVADNGVITEVLIDTQALGGANDAYNTGILKLDGDLVAVGYHSNLGVGTIATLTIDNAGSISAPLDSAGIGGANRVKLFSLGIDVGISYFGVFYNDPAPDDTILRTFSCAADGTLSAEIDDLTLFDTTGQVAYGRVYIQPDIWAFTFTDTPAADGLLATVGIETIDDYSNDGLYVEFDNAPVEVQTQCYGVRVERGRETELGYAPAGVAELTMDNSSGDFSPENAAGAYYPALDLGIKVYIYEIYGGFTYDIFTGKIEKIVPQAVPGDGGAEAFILCTDGTDDLNDTPVETALRTDVQAGQLITDILDAASAFVGARDIDTGISTFEVAFFSSPSALKDIRTVEDQKRGRFYIDVDGDAQFEDRHHRILNHATSEYDFGEKLKDIQYEWSKRDLYNFIQLTGIQYTEDIANSYLWSTVADLSGRSVIVPGNGSVTIWATFSQVLASYTALVAGTHWNTNTSVSKTGTDTTGNVTVTTTQYGKALKIVFTSTFATDSYLVVPDTPPADAPADRSAIVMGKLYQEDVIQYTDEDAVSIAAYGKKGFPLEAPFISDFWKLYTLAAFLKSRFKDPQPMAIRVTVHGRTDWPTDDILKQVLSRKISDRVTLASTLLGFDQDFYIEKVIHDWKQYEGKFNLDVTWVCSRVSVQDSLVWRLEVAGFGELGVTTYLIY